MNLPIEGYLRRMDSREAADAGLLLWRENFVNFILFFAIPFWVCAFLSRLLPGKMVYFSYLILWWLKPFFDRLILHVISVRFFESGANLQRLRRGLGKSLIRGLTGDLLWRRFSPLRPAMMPVRMLELAHTSKGANKSGKKSRLTAERKKNLKKGGIDYCFLLSIWGIALEIALLIGEILFVEVIAELFMSDYSSPLFNNFPLKIEIFIYTAYCFNYMLVETIYVCMGFSLYINSRIEVEGWDLEIKFRSFAEKYGKKIITCVLFCVLCFACVFSPAEANADDLQPLISGENVPLEELQNILELPDFGSEKDSWGIRRKNQSEERELPNINFPPIFETLRLVFASILRIFLIAIAAALAVILFIFARKMINKKIPAKKKSTITPLHGIPSENPDILLEKSLEFYKQGELRLAWGYCTAAVILSWQIHCGIIFPPNATENDCANIVSKMQTNSSELHSDEIKIFGGLVKHWINFAYAGKNPPPESFNEAVCFCKSLRSFNDRRT